MAIETRPRNAPGPARARQREGLRARRIPHAPGRARAERHADATAATVAPNVALAGLELLVGYEWLVGGVDKLLFGTFPHALGGLLAQSLGGGHLPGAFAALLRGLVVPNATLFGYLIEWGEALAGLGLIAAALVELLRPVAARYLAGAWRGAYAAGERLIETLAPVAVVGAGLLGLSFFFLDGLPTPWFAPTIAYGGAIDTGLLLAGASVVLVVGRLARLRH